MTTYSKETALYDTGAIKNGIDYASTKADNFLSVDSSGIMVYDGSNGTQTPSSPSSTTRNVFIDSDSVDVRKGTTTLASFGTETVIKTTDGTELAHFGYAEGQAESGTAIKPYYTLGKRMANSTLGNYSVAEGYNITASGYCSYAEGYATISSGPYSHAEGTGTTTSGPSSHAENVLTTSSGYSSHAEGWGTTASGYYSHTQNCGTIAQRLSQTVLGEYNTADTGGTDETTRGDYAVIVGNGTSDSARSNAFTMDWDGNIIGQAMAGFIQMYAGATPPTGWLICDGASYLRSDYPTLFAALGGTSSPWGLPDNTHFKVPDFRGRAPIGAGTGTGLTARAIGDTFGEETHTLIADEVPAHTHGSKTLEGTMRIVGWAGSATNAAVSGIVTVTTNNAKDRTASSGSSMGSQTNKITATHTHTSFGGGGAHENMQPSAVVNFIICTGKTA